MYPASDWSVCSIGQTSSGPFGSPVFAGTLIKGKKQHILVDTLCRTPSSMPPGSGPRWRPAVARHAVWQVSSFHSSRNCLQTAPINVQFLPTGSSKILAYIKTEIIKQSDRASYPRPLDPACRFRSRLRYRSQLRVSASPSDNSIARRHAATIFHPFSVGTRDICRKPRRIPSLMTTFMESVV
jgi:hypothetical protein